MAAAPRACCHLSAGPARGALFLRPGLPPLLHPPHLAPVFLRGLFEAVAPVQLGLRLPKPPGCHGSGVAAAPHAHRRPWADPATGSPRLELPVPPWLQRPQDAQAPLLWWSKLPARALPLTRDGLQLLQLWRHVQVLKPPLQQGHPTEAAHLRADQGQSPHSPRASLLQQEKLRSRMLPHRATLLDPYARLPGLLRPIQPPMLSAGQSQP
mmetsp:Transcript_104578/g.271045  ORF Transcript_104578/g.271045 Transcript_104578/m.271045 type:complete len:210 (+) Transcript_104578:113-742(+)